VWKAVLAVWSTRSFQICYLQFYAECLVSLCQYFKIIFLRSIPVRKPNSEQLQGYRYLKFKMTVTLHKTSGSLLHLASKIGYVVPLFILCIHTPCLSCNTTHGNLGGQFCRQPQQSIGQGTAHSGTLSCVA
jgi:hypothetical protein